MRRLRTQLTLAGLMFVVLGRLTSNAQAKHEAPDFKEVYDLIRANVPGLSEAELNRAAVQGLLDALGSKVSLATNGAQPDAALDSPLVSRTEVFEKDIAYVRIARVAGGLTGEMETSYRQLSASNRLQGVVLDLRYAHGTDYSSAVALAQLFVSKARPLLDWGNGMVSANAKTNAINEPVAVLVNRETAGAAEALAAMLRSAGAGLILGSRTAGQALLTKDFPLKTGGVLRIATMPVKLGDGSTISAGGVKPDIEVAVNAEEERAYYADAFYMGRKTNLTAGASGALAILPAGTNGARRVRINEAELVREHRDGLDRGGESLIRPVPSDRPSEPEVPLVTDPALARALDLLKGLAVVRQPRP